VYRLIHEMRAEPLLAQPVTFMFHPSFDDPSLEAAIVAPMPGESEFEARRRGMRVPHDVLPELAFNFEYPLLTRDQEQHLFRKMNFLKYKAGLLRKHMISPGSESSEIDPARVQITDLKDIEVLVREANRIKNLVISCNTRLVTSYAKKHVTPQENLFELISDGNMSLLRAVEKFDFSRGNKFSTYASWAIIRSFAHSVPEVKKRMDHYPTGYDELFAAAPDSRSDEHECLVQAEEAADRVHLLLQTLHPREQRIMRMRAGLDSIPRSMTLAEIGKVLGITRERVRQLHLRSMAKLKRLAINKYVEWM